MHLRQLVHLPKPVVPGRVQLPKALRQPRLLRIDTWVDPLTYLPVRTRSDSGFGWSVADTTWLPRTPANIAKTRLVVPRGFKHEQQNGGGFSVYTHAVTFRCAQS
jgi:hypothetical protein